jgi:ATP-dependent RNA helicase SUPV3L1/SUV3
MEPQLLQSPVTDMPGMTKEDVANAVQSYRNFIWDAVSPVTLAAGESKKHTDMVIALRAAFLEQGQAGIDEHLKYAFYGHVLGGHFTEINLQNQKGMADLRYPTEWFPKARGATRTIHLHIGPTNSGKTYHALKRLEQSTNGVYAGPLRLLAHEVYSRLNAKGLCCALVTGEEQRLPPGWKDEASKAVACTVEMVPLDRYLDVAVIDEIQMLGDMERGWAWTSALTGVLAKEIHVCGEERALPLVMQIAAAMGEKVEVHRYKRLTPLKTETQSLNGNLKLLRKGDCVVTFSVMAIHTLRQEIEKTTGKKAAVVYGNLPPETRAQQARLFNDPNNDYDYLVASDAIGMGLNLSAASLLILIYSTNFKAGASNALYSKQYRSTMGRASSLLQVQKFVKLAVERAGIAPRIKTTKPQQYHKRRM